MATKEQEMNAVLVQTLVLYKEYATNSMAQAIDLHEKILDVNAKAAAAAEVQMQVHEDVHHRRAHGAAIANLGVGTMLPNLEVGNTRGRPVGLSG